MSEQKHKGENIRTFLLIFVVITLFYCTGYAQQGTLTWLGTLGDSSSMASCVSDDGLVVTGYARHTLNENIAFRWTAVTGMQNLGTLGGKSSEATVIP